jgi:hypothetical protein
MRSVLVLFLFALPVTAQESFSQARKSLSSAIAKVDAGEAKSAVRSLQEIGTRQAVDALAKSFDLVGRRNRILLFEKESYLREIGKLPGGPQGQVLPGSPLETMYVKFYAVQEKLRHLSEIRTGIVESFDRMDRTIVLKSFLKKWKKGDANSRADMVRWLGGSGLPDARKTLLKRLKKEKEPLVRKAILDGFAKAREKEKSVLEAIAGQLEDPCWQVSLAAVRALEAGGSADAVLPLIRFLTSARARMAVETNDALYRLTGVDKHGDPATWMAWWNENGEAFRKEGRKKSPSRRKGKGAGKVTSFYGIPLQSDKVIFVVDLSKSMSSKSRWVPPKDVATGQGPTIRLKEKTRIGVARYEVKRALALLPDGAAFNIIFLHQKVWAFRSQGMEILNPVTRRKAFKFVDDAELAFGTDIYSSLESAFGFSGVFGAENRVSRWDADTIFLISDGRPFLSETLREFGVSGPRDISAAVEGWNRGPDVIIHSITILDEEGKGGKQFMERLAENNSGTYVER